MRRHGLIGEVGNEITPFLAVAPGLILVVEDCGCEAAGDREEDHPVAAG